MEKQLMRFEIIRALANAVYEANDPANDSTVQIYEWTPERSQLEASRTALDNLAGSLSSEVFTCYASLYLVATSPASTRADLDRLRGNRLFTGVWLSDPPPAAPKPVIVPPPAPVIRGVSLGKVLGWVLACSIVAFVVGLLLQSSMSSADQKATQDQLDSARSQLASVQSELGETRQGRDNDKGQSSQLRSRLEQYNGIHVLRITNTCREAIHAAVRYKSFNGNWVTEGWLILQPHDSSLAAASTDPNFYVYAKSQPSNLVWWDTTGFVHMAVQDPEFTYTTGQSLTDSSVDTVQPRHYTVQTESLNQSLDCDK